MKNVVNKILISATAIGLLSQTSGGDIYVYSNIGDDNGHDGSGGWSQR